MKKNTLNRFIRVGAIALICSPALLPVAQAMGLNPNTYTGGGNITNDSTSAKSLAKLDHLKDYYLARVIRIGMFSYWNVRDKKPILRLSELPGEVAARGRNIALSFNWTTRSTYPILSYQQYYDIGRFYAQQPETRRVVTWQIFNEPIVFWNPGEAQSIPTKAQYRNAVEGFADGVRSVKGAGAQVAPAGYAGPATNRNFTSSGYISAIAPLVNDRTLSGIDLHCYYNNNRGQVIPNNFRYSPQSLFEGAQAESGITRRDTQFWCTEFGLRWRNPANNAIVNNPTAAQEDVIAKRLLTVMWGMWSTRRQDNGPACNLALGYQLFDESAESLRMFESLIPSVPKQRAATLKQALNLSAGTRLVYSDPNGRGIIRLEHPDKLRLLVVKQNVPGWTNQLSTVHRVSGLSGYRTLKVFDYKERIQTIPINGRDAVTVRNLERDGTYMFFAHK